MRQIKFRGKCPNSGKWITGSLIQLFGFSYIVNDDHKNADCSTEVLPDTVSQFTGLVDKNGTEIYEGDVVQYEKVRIDWSKTIRTIEKFEIEYNDCANYNQDEASKLEIIGNIHDNPDLLNEKQ